MAKVLILLLGILACGGFVYFGYGVLSYFSPERRAVRRADRYETMELDKVRKQLDTAIDTLIKIAADDAGNPTLEAKLALDNISRKEVTQ